MLTPRGAEYWPPPFTIPSAAVIALAVDNPNSWIRSAVRGQYEKALDAEASGDALPLLTYPQDFIMGEDIVYPFSGHPERKCRCGNSIGAWHK